MAESPKASPVSLTEEDLKKAIEDYYLPKHLVKAIYEIGHIPTHSQESHVGVGFIDIADYTYLSKFLSPKENQILLNGLYTAFQMVLERHGGFLNKIEGDSLMFHFDDIIDRRLWNLDKQERITYIARELFFTCIEMQRVCTLFNRANDRFIDTSASAEARTALQDAFAIIHSLRNKNDLSSTLYAFFQIRIRVGANIGEVTIGNFGPSGSKQWDVIGLPVINAKRMESTAPVGGLRISSEFYDILLSTGIARDYFNRFKREAMAYGSIYKNITEEELFAFREVIVHEKKGASYRTYSVQVDPSLPETIVGQSEELLNHGPQGAARIIEFIKYYRGNHYVINSLEKLFKEKGIEFRKDEIIQRLQPKKFESFAEKAREQRRVVDDLINAELNLFEILQYLDKYQDMVQVQIPSLKPGTFISYESYTKEVWDNLMVQYEQTKQLIIQKTYFFEVLVPFIYSSLEASIIEYQQQAQAETEQALELEELIALD